MRSEYPGMGYAMMWVLLGIGAAGYFKSLPYAVAGFVLAYLQAIISGLAAIMSRLDELGEGALTQWEQSARKESNSNQSGQAITMVTMSKTPVRNTRAHVSLMRRWARTLPSSIALFSRLIISANVASVLGR